jgi:glycosyltransferase involved in cell wall biosynthesis
MVCDPISNVKSGSVISSIRFAQLLQKQGHHIIFIGARTREHRDHNNHDGIKVYRYRGTSYPKSGGYYLAFPTVQELKKVFQKEKIDIVHIILPMSGALVAMRAARLLGIKVVTHSHSQPENLFIDMPKFIRPILHDLWNKYLRWLYGKTEYVIYPSEIARDLLHLNKKNQPSAVISNGINLKEFKPTDIGNFYKRFNIPGNTVKLLFVGRLYPEKSVDTLIKAVPYIVEKQENIHIMIVGAGHLRQKLEKLVKDLRVQKYVTFLGLISDKDKVLAYNACDIFVLPSLAELEGMVVLEAMACAKPIVIANTEMSAARYFVQGNGFLFKALDYKDLAAQALKLITDDELRKKFGQVSLKNIEAYDINRSVELLENVYYSVLGIDKSNQTIHYSHKL